LFHPSLFFILSVSVGMMFLGASLDSDYNFVPHEKCLFLKLFLTADFVGPLFGISQWFLTARQGTF